ncbi:Topoisomerase II-associated protein PAT1 [Zostera marina]|uniref:Topoisomerase II-associated protein PAT1 n=1 Tax=Zostera marina TaxID=29655 RepID=A0A0K9P5I4_ZOSMR|nr:Topoisomerase II-associated protein PAT1 [Zostera marina]
MSLPQYPSVQITESNSLHRTSSYPHQQQHQHSNLNKPITVPKFFFPSFLPPNSDFHVLPNLPYNSTLPSFSHGVQMPLSTLNLPSFSDSHLHYAAVRHGGNMGQLTPGQSNQGLNLNQSNILPQQFHHPDSNMKFEMFSQQQQQIQRNHFAQPSISNFAHLQSQLPCSNPSPTQMVDHFGTMVGLPHQRDQRFEPVQGGRQNIRFHPNFRAINNNINYGWPQRYRSKYMSNEELVNILRVQLAATHSNDPYVDDYPHQASLAKKSEGSRLKHHFCPQSIRDFSSRPIHNPEPHPYLKVDALGRLPFSSIRRPRPLLDVDSPSATSEKVDPEHKQKALDQEPMLAARITIEDGLCLLLDIDDIDRLLKFRQPQDGGSQLMTQRDGLLNELAASLQLVDPLRTGNTGQPIDDVIFLRLASLPKGLNLLSRFLHLLMPGSKLTRVICMAIFRHLQFIFGRLNGDATTKLANAISSSVSAMDLNDLSTCLFSVACSSEHPPLRPIGSLAGDGATVIIKSVLDRSTVLLMDRHSANNCITSHRDLWQESFNSFFPLLMKHCLIKYDDIMKPHHMETRDSTTVASEIAKAISREMPVDLLRACLPHTDEQQRKHIVDFAQRSVS